MPGAFSRFLKRRRQLCDTCLFLTTLGSINDGRGSGVRDLSMTPTPVTCALLAVEAIPFIYYGIALYSSFRFFSGRSPSKPAGREFVPPVSNLKPIRGLDPDAAENLASFCRLDYPEYEIVFCVDADDQAVLSVLTKLTNDFPQCHIRILYGSLRVATNDKVAKLARLVSEAAYETVVISDSDVRVRPDYLRRIVAPLRDRRVGARHAGLDRHGAGRHLRGSVLRPPQHGHRHPRRHHGLGK